MGSLGMPELLIILVILFLLFGASKLPQLARSIGRAKKEFEEAAAEGRSKPTEKQPEEREAGETSSNDDSAKTSSVKES